MFLNYLALAITLMGITLVFYTFIYIHEIPYELAKKRNHPQTDAIYVACWLSLFTLHALWPLVFLWAITNPRALPVKLVGESGEGSELLNRLQALEQEIAALKGGTANKPAIAEGASHD